MTQKENVIIFEGGTSFHVFWLNISYSMDIMYSGMKVSRDVILGICELLEPILQYKLYSNA